MPEGAGVNVGLGLDISPFIAASGQLRGSISGIMRSINKITLASAIKGDPFSQQVKYMNVFSKSLDSTFHTLSDLGIAFTNVGTKGSKEIKSMTITVSTLMDKLDKAVANYKNLQAQATKKVADKVAATGMGEGYVPGTKLSSDQEKEYNRQVKEGILLNKELLTAQKDIELIANEIAATYLKVYKNKAKLGALTEQDKAQVLVLAKTREAYDALDNKMKRVYVTSLGYSKSLAEVKIRLTEVKDRLGVLQTIYQKGMFKKDVEGAKKLSVEIKQLQLEYQELALTAKRRTTMSVGTFNTEKAELDSNKAILSIEQQSKSIKELKQEYRTLALTKEKLEGKKGLQYEQALSKTLADQSRVARELGKATTKLTSEQAALYVEAEYGVKSLATLDMEYKALERESLKLQSPKLKQAFHETAAGAEVYELKLRKVTETLQANIVAQLQLEESQRITALGGVRDNDQALAADKELLAIRKKLNIAETELDNTQTSRKKILASKELRENYSRMTLELTKLDAHWDKTTRATARNTVLVTKLKAMQEMLVKAKAAGVALDKNQNIQLLKVQKTLKKIDTLHRSEAGAMNLDFKRMKWFAQLRLYWAAYQLATQAVQGAIEFEQKLANAAAIATATTAEFKKMSAAALLVGSTTRYSAAEAADGMMKIAQAGFSAAESIILIQDVAHLATATLTDLTQAANLVTTAIRAWRLEADQGTMVVDSFASAVSNSKLTMDGLVTSFNYVTGIAPELGMSLQEVLAALGQMTNRGLSASKAGTSLRAMLARLLQPNKRFIQALHAVNLELIDVNPELHNFEEILTTLKTAGFDVSKAFQGMRRRAAAGISLLVSTADTYGSLTDRMYEAGRASEMAQKNLATMSGQWKQFNDVLVATIAGGLGPASESFQGLILILRGVVVAIAPLLISVGNVLSDFSKLNSFMKRTFIMSSVAKKFDTIRQSLHEVNEELIAQRHNLIALEQDIDRISSSYTKYNKLLKIGRFGASERTGELAKELSEAEGKLKAFKRAEELGLIENSLLLTYRKELVALDKLIDGNDKRKRATIFLKDLKTTEDELTNSYKIQLATLVAMKHMEQERIKSTALKALSLDAETCIIGLEALADSYKKFKTEVNLKDIKLIIAFLFGKFTAGENKGLNIGEKRLKALLSAYKAIAQTLKTMPKEDQSKYLSEIAEKSGKSLPQLDFTLKALETFFDKYEVLLKKGLTPARASADAMEAVLTEYKITFEDLLSFNTTLPSKLSKLEAKLNTSITNLKATASEMEALEKVIAGEKLKKGSKFNWMEDLMTKTKLSTDDLKIILEGLAVEYAKGYEKVIEVLTDPLASKALKKKAYAKLKDLFAVWKVEHPKGTFKNYLELIFTGVGAEERIKEVIKACSNVVASELTALFSVMDSRLSEIDILWKTKTMGFMSNTNFEIEAEKAFDGLLQQLEAFKIKLANEGILDSLAGLDLMDKQLLSITDTLTKFMKSSSGVDLGVRSFIKLGKSMDFGTGFDKLASSTEGVDKVKNILLDLRNGAISLESAFSELKINKSLREFFKTMVSGFSSVGAGRPISKIKEELALYQQSLNLAKKRYELNGEYGQQQKKTLTYLQNELTIEKATFKFRQKEKAALAKSIAARAKGDKGSLAEANKALDDLRLKKDFDKEEEKKLQGAISKILEDQRKDYKKILAMRETLYQTELKIKALYEQQDKLVFNMKLYGQSEALQKSQEELENARASLKIARLKSTYLSEIPFTEASTTTEKKAQLKLDEQSLAIVRERLEKEEVRAANLSKQIGTSYYEAARKFLEMELDTEIAKLTIKNESEISDKERLRNNEKIFKITRELVILEKDQANIKLGNLKKLKTKYSSLTAELTKLQATPTNDMDKATKVRQEEEILVLTKRQATLEKLIIKLSSELNESTNKRIGFLSDIQGYLTGNKQAQEEILRKSDDINDAWYVFKTTVGESSEELQHMGSLAEQLGDKLKEIPAGLQLAFGDAAADWGMQTFMGEETERTKDLKDRYAELMEARKEAMEQGTPEQVAEINAQLADTNKLLDKESTLWTQAAVAFKNFADILIKELMRIAAQMAIVAAIKFIGKVLAIGNGGVVDDINILAKANGGLLTGGRYPVNSYAGGGATDKLTMAFLGDNPSKKELIIPSENIKKDSVSGYTREKESSKGNVTVVNMLSKKDIATAMLDKEGESVIINAIGKDIQKKGPIYRLLRSSK